MRIREMLLPTLLASAALAAMAGETDGRGASPIVVLFTDRPPYYSRSADGTVNGLVATPALQAFNKAGIRYELQESSPARLLEALKRNDRRLCVLGLYKTPERERTYKYTKAVSQDQPMVGLSNVAFSAPAGITVPALLADPKVTVLTKEAVNYGPHLEKYFPGMKAKRSFTGAGYGQIVKMIMAGRGQLTFFPQEEAQYYAKAAGYSTRDFSLIQFNDMPAGEKRHIVCTQLVDDAEINKLNAELPNR